MNDDALLAIASEFDELNSDTGLEVGRLLHRLDRLRENIARARPRSRVALLRAKCGGNINSALLAARRAVEAAEQELSAIGETVERIGKAEQRLRLEVHPTSTRLRAEVDLEASRMARLDSEIKALTAARSKSIQLLESSGMSLDAAAEIARPAQSEIDALVEQRTATAARHEAMVRASRSTVGQVEYLRAAA